MKFYIVLLSLTLSTNTLAAELKIDVPAEPNTKFFLVQKAGERTARTMITKHVGPSGTSYSKRLYDCDNSTYKHLGSGSSSTQIDESRPEKNMRQVTQGSINYYLGNEACKEENL